MHCDWMYDLPDRVSEFDGLIPVGVGAVCSLALVFASRGQPTQCCYHEHSGDE